MKNITINEAKKGDLITATCDVYNGGRKFTGSIRRINATDVVMTTKNQRSTKCFSIASLNIISVVNYDR